MWFPGSRNGKREAGAPGDDSSGRIAASSRTILPQSTPSTRTSRGLEEFFGHIHGLSGLTLLDLGGATQQNVSFITDLGHRLYSENFLQILRETSNGEGMADQSNPGLIEYFLRQALDYPEGHFDGVLIWDVLEYLAPALLTAVVERLHKVVRPGSYMLAFFHADDKLEAVPYYTFRIQDVRSLQVLLQGTRRPLQLFNNRSLERLFTRSESVKFFLTKDRLREVVVKA
ncbi:MAG TPA: class I SAM-dependent methyltransferase [Bryobacteraceae bacterium]|jgi:2-polyprenyl-3-methyl-5-hydroxy-6-metoxy-1,4-benzoquinol methylase|nr:class I SAM-dependent methyltransferase [Bryobacteraceae bacterium]